MNRDELAKKMRLQASLLDKVRERLGELLFEEERAAIEAAASGLRFRADLLERR